MLPEIWQKKATRRVLQKDVNLAVAHRVFSPTRKAGTESQQTIVWPRTRLVQFAAKKATTSLVAPKEPKLTPNP